MNLFFQILDICILPYQLVTLFYKNVKESRDMKNWPLDGVAFIAIKKPVKYVSIFKNLNLIIIQKYFNIIIFVNWHFLYAKISYKKIFNSKVTKFSNTLNLWKVI